MASQTQVDIERLYDLRFSGQSAYRTRVWQTLVKHYFAQFIREDASVLDLGCGYCDFINNIVAKRRFAMDLNPHARALAAGDVNLIEQDCSQRWPLEDASLDVVFTSNFLEHLPDKASVGRTLAEARRCLKPGGTLICMGPNIRFVPGEYWDFWDHHTPLSDKSLSEALRLLGFSIERCVPRFLPYTMSDGPRAPLAFVRTYLHLPMFWPLFGRQFLVVAKAA